MLLQYINAEVNFFPCIFEIKRKNTMWVLFAIFIILLSIAIIIALRPSKKFAKSIRLEKNFASLGDMKGMSKQEIISKVGEPNTVCHISDSEILQWRDVTFYIAIYFDPKGMFSGITYKSNEIE